MAGHSVCVFAPAPLLTVTLETAEAAEEDTEIHLHAGGQGFWIARLVQVLGAEVELCSTFGGETGRVVRGLLDEEPLTLRAVRARAAGTVATSTIVARASANASARCVRRRSLATKSTSSTAPCSSGGWTRP
jgi:fructose-1-phosphate kinase PfkB-like protein